MSLKFRDLRADELEVRVAREVGQNKDMVELLVYKDSRCDMRILDETVGNTNWNVAYKREGETLLGGIGIYVPEHNAIIVKWAAGAESNIEATKGEQSDALKRAGFVWGIGRALYTAPKIIIKGSRYDTFKVSKIDYKDDKISDLRIVDNKGKVVYDYENFEVKKVMDLEKSEDAVETLRALCTELKEDGADTKELLKYYNYYCDKIGSWQRVTRESLLKLWQKWIEKAVKS